MHRLKQVNQMNQHNKRRHMLVVDDDPIIRDMMVDILDFEGYSIRTARNGYEALEILRSEDNYLVFLDILMPGMSGIDVCRVLNADPQLRRRHSIVLCSAMDNLTGVTSLNADLALPKPFTVAEVLGIVKKLKSQKWRP
jgi:CheY-like chemotaxis protein